MQTVLLVGKMETGRELEVRHIHENFPVETLAGGIGIERLVAFIGSGIYALELTAADGYFQENFHRFLSNPDIRELFEELGEIVEGLPGPDTLTADMPLAAAMMIWQPDNETDRTSV